MDNFIKKSDLFVRGVEFLKGSIIMGNELDSMCGISDEELTERFKEAIRIDNERKRAKGAPIAGFDMRRKQAYLEYADGRRRYAGEE